MKLKISTGFRKDQKFTIDAEEAHKAYYLFLNPEKRGIFNNGIALIGKQIQSIEPDYNATMCWNDTHVIDNDDWNQIHSEKIKEKMEKIMITAKEVVTKINTNPELFNTPMSLLIENKITKKSVDNSYYKITPKTVH